MTDQANKLRSLMQGRKVVSEIPKSLVTRVITISSGKGGVGKSNFTLNLAIQLAKRNKRVVIIDADFGLANIEVLYGAVSRHTLQDVITGSKAMNEILLDGPLGIKILSGGSGFSQIPSISDNEVSILIEKLNFLDKISDIILVDTGAGISTQVTDFIKASSEAIIITTPEPTSITDAYAIIKKIKEQDIASPTVHVVVNRVESKKEGEEVYEKLRRVCDKYLNIHIKCLGLIPYDPALVKAVKQQKPVSIIYPNAPVAKRIERISLSILNNGLSTETSDMSSFMNKLVGIFSGKSL